MNVVLARRAHQAVWPSLAELGHVPVATLSRNWCPLPDKLAEKLVVESFQAAFNLCSTGSGSVAAACIDGMESTLATVRTQQANLQPQPPVLWRPRVMIPSQIWVPTTASCVATGAHRAHVFRHCCGRWEYSRKVERKKVTSERCQERQTARCGACEWRHG